MKNVEIKNIKDVSEEINLIAFVERVNTLVSSNGSNYLILHLSDQTGRIEARKWSAEKKDIESIITGKIFNFKVKTSIYKNILQLKINEYKELSEDEISEFGLNLSNFVIKAPIDIEKSFSEIIKYVSSISNETYKSITLKILQDNESEFKNFSAAINIHHNVVGGLLWHSITLMKNILAVKENYYDLNIDWELAACGAILHDIGKIYEMNKEIADDYTFEGKLLGHISIGSEMVSNVANELNIKNEDVIKLKHMILSSHGKKEFGSPQEPVLIEGILISTFDNLDARLFKVNSELEKIENGKWTQRILTEDGKMFYKHNKK